MKWKLWRLGALVSIVLSLLVAGAGLAAGVTWQAFVATFCAACLTHFGSYLMKHPVDQIQFDTETFVKTSTITDPKTGAVATEKHTEQKQTPVVVEPPKTP